MSCCTQLEQKKSIMLTAGDDSNAFGNTITITITSDLDMTGWKAIVQLDKFQWDFSDLADGPKTWDISREITSQLAAGEYEAAIKVFDATGLCRTVLRGIAVYVNEQVVDNPTTEANNG